MRITTSFVALAIAVLGGTPAAAAPASFRAVDPLVVRTCVTSWPAPTHVVARAEAAMLPIYEALPSDTRAEATLSIEVAGVSRPIAGGIGIAPDGSRISALHTTACDGVLRVASPEPIRINLWQLFEQWDVRLTQHCLGETCDAEGVRIAVDGREVRMCPGAIPIDDGTSIELSVD